MVSEDQAKRLDPPPTVSPTRRKSAPDRGVDWIVFGSAMAACLGFVAWGVVDAEGMAATAQAALDVVLGSTGWLYVAVTSGLVVLAAVLAFSRYGNIRLGHDDDRPELSTRSWTAMLFAAGMGIGLVFWGIAEPLSHLATPPLGAAEAGTSDAARLSMEYTIFHWGLHPWALYAMIGLPLAFAIFRKGRPSLLSSIVVPNKPTTSWPARAVNVFSAFMTTFGAATSLGLGVIQINSGLAQNFGIPENNTVGIATIAGITTLFVLSAVTGIHKGIKHVSTINAGLAGLLLAFVFVFGPSIHLLQTFIEALGGYAANLVPMSTETGAHSGGEWVSGWTVFYWAWWMFYAPFVGTFIARISRGRTIRQFLIGVLVVPTVVSLAWFAVMGGTAMHMDLSGAAPLTDTLAESGEQGVLFAMFAELPVPLISSLVVMALIALFFVSSADSASIVLAMFCQHGELAPRRGLVVVWGVTISLTAAVLLLAGGLAAIQTASIVLALPFLILLVIACFRFVRELRREFGPMTDDGAR